jgi:hypothetical protein
MLSVVLHSIILPIVVILSAIKQSVIMLGCVMLSVIISSFVTQNVVMLCVAFLLLFLASWRHFTGPPPLKLFFNVIYA